MRSFLTERLRLIGSRQNAHEPFRGLQIPVETAVNHPPLPVTRRPGLVRNTSCYYYIYIESVIQASVPNPGVPEPNGPGKNQVLGV